MKTIKIGTKSFTLSDAEVKAAEWDILEIYDWIENAIRNKARQCIDQLILDHTTVNPKKIPVEEKETIIQGLTIKSARERMKEMEKI